MLIAQTDERFADFAPYVAAINDDGVVAFQATLRTGGTGVYSGTGGPVTALIDGAVEPLRDICSHPDIDAAGSACCYVTLTSGRRGLALARDGETTVLDEGIGPLGPTMNASGTIAFRVETTTGGSAILVRSDGPAMSIADASGRLKGFQGLPVIDGRGAVVFRADLSAGGQGIYVGDGGPPTTIAETGGTFHALGRFPFVNAAGTVAFCATLRDGREGVFVVSEGSITTVVDTTGPYQSVRGVLLDDSGTAIFYATARRGSLGVFTGPDPVADRVLALDAPVFGSAVVDFALNPVSVNAAGQLAIRVTLADGRGCIVRADPT